jgi:HlyD family secretion protein
MRHFRQMILAMASVAAACKHEDVPDAYGNIEATTVTVGSQSSGQLVQFTPAEGVTLIAGTVVGLVDTIPLALQKQQILAQRAATASRTNEVSQQIDVLEVQRAIAQRTYERTKRLFDQQAATAQQLDQAERDYRTLTEQIQAAAAQRHSVTEDVSATTARVAQIDDQIRKSRVSNPTSGTVLTTYAKAGEVVQSGQPLYRIANLDTVELRAYVTEPQLTQLRVGQRAQVSVDVGRGRRTLTGQVTWVSSEAEFTPTPIQTRDERASLVYAVKLRVANTGGILKIGMPADVRFTLATATAASP